MLRLTAILDLSPDESKVRSDLSFMPRSVLEARQRPQGIPAISVRKCSKTFLAPQEKPLDEMYLPVEKAEMVLRLLLEGNGVASVERITEVHSHGHLEAVGARW